MKFEGLPAWNIDIVAFMIMTPCRLVGLTDVLKEYGPSNFRVQDEGTWLHWPNPQGPSVIF